MLDPYKMVIVNVIGSFLLLTSALIYRYIYPQKKINLFWLLLIISILPIISVFRIGTYESGDFNIHVRRGMEFYEVLKQGNLMPSWAGDLNATYGYPLFIFNYTLPYYIISLFHFLGFSFIGSLKLFLASNFILSGIFMYLFSKNYFKNNLAGFITSIFYLFTPYHLISLHFKVTIGEILAYTFIPLTFYFAHKFLENKKNINILLSGLFLGLIMLSHIFIGMFLIPVISLYVILENKQFLKGTLYSLGIIIVSLFTSMYQWASPLIYQQYMFTTAYPTDPIKNFYFPNIIDLLYSPWKLGLLFQGPKGELSFLLGYAELLVFISVVVLILKKRIRKEDRKMLIMWTLLFSLTVFIITPYSIFIWRYLPIINQAGSQRLLIIAAIYTSLFAGYVSLSLKKKELFIYVLVIFAIGTTILNWGQRRVIPTINDAVLRRDLSLGNRWGDAHFYALPKWVSPRNLWFLEIPKNRIDVINGKADIKEISRSSIKHKYELNALTNVTLRENTLYFAGWKGTVNSKPINLMPDKNGIINLSLPKGNYILILHFEDLLPFYLSKIVSLISIFLVLLYSGFYTLKNKLIKFPKF